MKLSPSYFSKKYHFTKVNLLNLFLLSNQKYPHYHQTFQIAILTKFPVQFKSICNLCCHCLCRFSKFSGTHFESIMVNSHRLRTDTCYFCLGKLIHFKIKMSLPLDYFSQYFSKQQFPYLDCVTQNDPEFIFRSVYFLALNTSKQPKLTGLCPPPWNPTRSFNPRSCQEIHSASSNTLKRHVLKFLVSYLDSSVCDPCINYPHQRKLGRKHYATEKLNFAKEKTRLFFHVKKH